MKEKNLKMNKGEGDMGPVPRSPRRRHLRARREDDSLGGTDLLQPAVLADPRVDGEGRVAGQRPRHSRHHADEFFQLFQEGQDQDGGVAKVARGNQHQNDPMV